MTSLTTSGYLVLGLVRFAGSATPYDLKSLAEDTVGPFWALPHTQIYAQCDKLVAAGLLAEERETEGRRKRTLTITEAGIESLAGWLGDDTFVPIEARDLALLKLFFGANPADIGPTQVAEHRSILAKYEGLMANAGDDLPPGPRGALELGIQYERWMVEFWTQQMKTGDTLQ